MKLIIEEQNMLSVPTQYRIAALKPLLSAKPFILITDLEGPFLRGDTAMLAMSEYVQPLDRTAGDTRDYGAELYTETYNWYTEAIKNNGQGQEGGDITFCLAPLLAMGVTNAQIQAIAHHSGVMDGASELIKFIHRHNGVIIGLTTAWERYHRGVVAPLGFDDLFGTTFSLEVNEEALSEALEGVRRFLDDSFALMRRADLRALHERIADFYQKELGLWEEYSIHPLGKFIKESEVIGDIGKREVAKALKAVAGEGAVVVAMGDGLNDVPMLAEPGWTVAINGPDAVRTAAIGAVTEDMRAFIPFFSHLLENPAASYHEVVAKSNQHYSQPVFQVTAGNPSAAVLAQHAQMRQKLKQHYALIP